MQDSITLTDFLLMLRKTVTGNDYITWFLDGRKRIRASGGEVCPITGVVCAETGYIYSVHQTRSAMERLGREKYGLYEYGTASWHEDVLQSADADWHGGRLGRMRQMLLWATGLSDAAN
jgi:hypothetical protein